MAHETPIDKTAEFDLDMFDEVPPDQFGPTLPLYPAWQWTNGSQRQKAVGGIAFTGGWFLPEGHAPEGLKMNPWTFVTENGTEVPGFSADTLQVAVIAYRRCWQVGSRDSFQRFPWEAFSLSPSDFNSTLATWGDLLIVGMKGETEAARRIMAYLLEAEQRAGANGASERLTDLSDNRLLRCAVIPEDDPILKSSLRVMRDTQNILILRARQVEAEEALHRLQAKRQGELPISPEQERTLLRMIDRLASYRVSPERPYARVYLGIRSWLRARVGFSFFRGIIRKQFPLAQSLLAEAIRREEAAQEQLGCCLVREEKDEQ